MAIRANLSGVSSGFEPVPAGRYVTVITDITETETKGGKLPAGTPMLNVELTIKDPAEFADKKLFTNVVLHEKTMFKWKELLEATGNYSEDELNGDLSVELEDLMNSEVTVIVNMREYEGEDRNNVKRFVKAGAAAASGREESLLP